MRKLPLLLTGMVGALLLTLAVPAFAADKSKEKSITGEAKCAKCMLKETDKCQTVIQVEGKKGKIVTYYLTDNEVSKAFHPNVCTESKKATATGLIQKGDGKKEFTASKITLVK